MKSVVHEKDLEIVNIKNYIDQLKTELEKKKIEIQEKDEVIRRLEDDEESTDESDGEGDLSYNKNENYSQLIGSGYFGKHFEIRKGMEKEAEALRMEWRGNQKHE